MEERIQKLEAWAEKTSDRIAAIERELGIIRSNYATKEDLHRELHSLTWKVIGAIAVLCAAVFWMARNVQPIDAPRSAEQRVSPAPGSAGPLVVPVPAKPAGR